MTSAAEFNCILCKETFENKDELQIHFRKHGDPKFNESIKIKSRVQSEMPLAYEKSNDAPEMVNCDVCDEIFPTISKAITHKHKVHPEHDAKYFCPWCGKLFTMKHLYNKHLQTNHETAEEVPENKDSHFQCDSCNVYFFVPAAMIYHNKFFHRQDTDLPVIGHSKKQRWLNQELVPVYYCSFCGEEYINKVNLHKHICDDHDDENQRPTDVLRCPLCEAIFYHLDAYELHLTFHSSEDLYIETNEMNEKEMAEFSLETVAPLMERIEDLNNLPDGETDANSVGIESFLQMAMDEPNNQLPGKVKSKKHKKHKKSKKSAITLDEFFSMNQDVFGEDIDFQGIEEVPTKVIKSQLKVKKQSVPKTGVKLVSSTDLQKLQKQGIVVKVQSGNKPKSSQIRQVGQPVKVNPQVKNLAIHTKTQAISASNDVLSKLLNQSSNQLKIVKKPAQEKVKSDEANEVIKDNLKDTIQGDGIASEKDAEIMETNGEDKQENENNEFDMAPVSSPQKSPANNKEECLNTEKKSINITKRDFETENKEEYDDTESNKAHTQQSKPYQLPSTNVNQNLHTGYLMNDKLKNIGKNITIKSIAQATNKTQIEEGPDETSESKVNDSDIKEDPNIDLKTEEKNVIQRNKSLDVLKSLNSSITIKSLKPTNVPGSNKNSTTNIDKTDKLPKQVSQNNSDSSPKQQLKLSNSTEITLNRCDDIKEKPIHMKASPQVLKNISKNITIKSMSPTARDTKEEDVTNDENDSDHYNEETDDEDNNPIVGLVPDRLKKHSPGNQLVLNEKISPNSNSSYTIKRPIANTKEKISNNEASVIDKELKNTNIQSGNNLLKHLKNITAKPVPGSKRLNQEVTTKFSNNTAHTNINNVVTKSMPTKEISEEIEIFNIDDSDEEAEQTKKDNLACATKKLEPTKLNINSQDALKAIKHISKNITVKSPNDKITVKSEEKSFAESNGEFFSDEDEMNDGARYDSNDDFDDHPTSNINFNMNQKDTNKCKDDSLNNVLKNLGKHITVKSRNASPSPSVKSFDRSSQDFHQNTTAYDTGSDEDYGSGKVKITEVTEQDDVDHISDCDNTGIVTQSPDDSNSGDEQFTKGIEENTTHEKLNINHMLSQHLKPAGKGLLKNISKNVTIKSLSERTSDNEIKTCKTDLQESELISNQSKLSKDLIIKSIKQNKPDEEKPRMVNMTNVKRMDGPSSTNTNIHPKLAKSGVSNTVNKEVKVQTFQSETVIEEITTTVTKTIRRVNQTVNQHQQVFNANQTSPAMPRMMKPKPGPRMAGVQPNKLHGVTVRQATPLQVRPKIRQTIPFRPPPPGTIVRPSNQLVPIRPSVAQIRPSSPRMPIKNIPRQATPRPVGKPLKISPNVVNHTMKKPSSDGNEAGHFSCFKKPKESLIPGNDTDMETGSNFQYASSSQTSKFCSTTQTIKGNSVVTSTQMKAESSQQQQINRLGKVAGLKIAKTNEVSRVERTELNASKRSALEAIEKLQKQGLLVKKPRVEEDTDPPNSAGEDYDEQFNDDDYDD